MRAAISSVCLLVLLGALGCEGSLVSGGTDGGGPGVDGGVVIGSDGGGTRTDGGGTTTDGGGGGTDAGEPPFDAGPCMTGDLASRLTVTSVAGVTASGRLFAAPTSTGGAVAAFGSGGTITMQRLLGGGAPSGAPVTVDGNGLWGFDLSTNGYAAMVSRGDDALYLVGVTSDGAPRFTEKLLGEVPHDVTNNEWFGTGIRYGRLLFTGSEWAAYYTVNRLWPDGIAHYGDQLRLFAEDGTPASMRWDWGCSHSMEVRIEHNGTLLGAVCASDCYPTKGIHFNHRGGQLYTDEGGSNCGGSYGTSLGGVVPMSDGFWVTFTATDARSSHDVALVKVGNDSSIGPPIWLTADAVNDGSVHAAAYGAGFVVAWSAGGTERIVRLDAAGVVAEGPVDLAAAGLASASDFFVFDGGDVGWVTSTGGNLALARLRSCE